MCHFFTDELAHGSQYCVDEAFGLLVMVGGRLPREEAREGIRVVVPFRSIVSFGVEFRHLGDV